MRVVVFGRSGQVARALSEVAEEWGIDLIACGRPETDITVAGDIARAVATYRPSAVINAAAFTAVDAAEDHRETAYALNEHAARQIAAAAAAVGVPLLHLSTDYVFDGRKGAPYTEEDEPNPVNVYGRSKLAGEQAVVSVHPAAVIVRSSWIFDGAGRNFLRAIVQQARRQPLLRVVDDQLGCPTPARELAEALLRLLPLLTQGHVRGVLHLCGTPATTWHGFALAILSEASRHGVPFPPVYPIATSDYPAKALRPADSRLDCRVAAERLGLPLPDWRTALTRDVARLCRG